MTWVDWVVLIMNSRGKRAVPFRVPMTITDPSTFFFPTFVCLEPVSNIIIHQHCILGDPGAGVSEDVDTAAESALKLTTILSLGIQGKQRYCSKKRFVWCGTQTCPHHTNDCKIPQLCRATHVSSLLYNK